MRKFLNKKRALALGAVAALVVGASAFAFLSSTGSGTGSGSASATTPTVTLTTDAATNGLFTNLGQTDTVKVFATNDTGNSNAHVSSISVTSVDQPASCPSGSFTADTPSVISGNDVPGTGVATQVGTIKVHFNDVASDQSSCLTGNYTVNLTSG